MCKIAFILLSGANGRGGHLYSARDLGLAFQEQGIEVSYYGLCMRGVEIEPLSGYGNYQRVELPDGLTAIFSVIRKVVRFDQFDALIILDEMALRLLTVSYPFSVSKIIAIKPGWINSKAWAPHNRALVCFSSENYEYFKSKKKYRRTNLQLIPQRVLPAESSYHLIDTLRFEYNLGAYDFVIMAAGRLDFGDGDSPGKKEIFEYSVSLYNRYMKNGCRPFLIFAGKPKNEETRNDAIDMLSGIEAAVLLDDDKYTEKLSCILAVSDVVIGYGRTAMEAMSLGVPVVVPVGKGKDGILVTNDTFELIQYHNFTNRVGTQSINLGEEASKIDRLHDEDFRLLCSAEMRKLFSKKLSATAAVERYKEIITAEVQNSLFRTVVTFICSAVRVTAFYKFRNYLNQIKKYRK